MTVRRSLLNTLSILLFIILLLPTVHAATLYGSIYTPTLDVAKNVLVTIDTKPVQRLLSTDGTYTFALSPGSYTLTLTNTASGVNETSTERVNITSEGEYRYDLFLFPSLDEEEALYDDITSDLGTETSLYLEETNYWPLALLILVILFILIVPVVWLKRHFKRLEREQALATGEDAYLERITKELKKAGGRMTQKELRKHVPESEAKVSLMVAELEAKGKIEKIKKGRGNILLLKRTK